MAEQDYATVGGDKVHKSDFGYAPGDEPSKWKFPLHDASHVRDAMARFNQSKGIPADAKAALKRKIIARAHKYGIDTSNFEKEYSRDTRIAVLMTGAGAAVETPEGIALHGPSTQLREVAIAVPGSWVKGDHDFSISKEDLSDMVRNFEKRQNGMIPIDYEHASEMPEVAKGGAIPAAGWIHKIAVSDQPSAVSKLKADSCVLTAFVEWTPQAEEMLRTGQYRFLSPAIDWGAKDKETGEPQGATLTSGALTNHPFLEELPPIMLSDGTVIGDREQATGDRPQATGNRPQATGNRPQATGNREQATGNREQETGNRNQKGAITMAEHEKKEKLEDPEEELTEDTEEKDGKGEHELPMLKIRKGRKGSKHEGHHILSDGDSDVGCMSEEDLRQHAAKHLGVNPDDDEDQKEAAREAERRSLLLTEVARDGKVDAKRATELADKGKITFADYIRATEAEKMIDAAVREGKILPRDRKFFFRDAIERAADFAEYLKSARAVTLGAQGLGAAERGTPEEEIDLGVKKLMRESKLDYASAFKQFLSENPVLAEQYRARHSRRVNADGTAG